MRRVIGGRAYRYCDGVLGDDEALRGFEALAKEVFNLDFAPWRKAGWWGGDYVPHLLMDEGRAAANVSANRIRALRRGRELRLIQLGTVMTHPACRGRGLARRLMEDVLEKYRDCDGFYLYANDSVLDFYPKFGFVPAEEWEYGREIKKSSVPARALDVEDERDRALLIGKYLTFGNPRSALRVDGNTGLLMFYCGRFLKDCVYEIPALDAVAVAEHDGGQMLCHDVFGGGAPLGEILSALARPETKTAVLGFTPLDAEGFTARPRREADTTLFVRGAAADLFAQDRLMFPPLFHA